MSISAIYILDLCGKPLISRDYRGAYESDIIDKFMISLMERDEEKPHTPVLQVDKITFAFIKCKNIYLVSTTNRNGNIALVFVFLHKLLQVMHDYFKQVEEESVRDNFVIIHELLDEILDFGYPQMTESNILMEYITQESKKKDIERSIPRAVTNTVSWRSEGIKYKKNELFLDVIESINLIAKSNGIVVYSEIAGSVQIKTQLSGMPELRLGLNDRLLYEKDGSDFEKCVDLDIKFHHCVRLCKFENDRNISFIPPDGEFELLSYSLNTYVKPPIWVDCVAELYPNSRIEYTVKATSHFKSKLSASYVDILIPVPCDVDSPIFKTAAGTVDYVPEKNVIKWSLKSFPGCKESFMTASFRLPSVTSEERVAVPPIQVKFEISFFNISGVKVKYLKITEKSGYLALPWVRHSTQNGDYQIRHREIVHRKKY